MEGNLVEHVAGVIAHLEQKRERLHREYSDVDQLLAGMRREWVALQQDQAPLFPETLPERALYTNMSVRWAVLCLLSEHSVGPQTTPAIADALRKGGISTSSQNFNSNVSAVLSQMAFKGEVLKANDGFVISPQGQELWANIRQSDKFLTRHQGAAPLAD